MWLKFARRLSLWHGSLSGEGSSSGASACHCTFCHVRTGSALGMLVLFDEARNVKIYRQCSSIHDV